MKVFEPVPKENYECIGFVNEADYQHLIDLDGIPVGASWAPGLVYTGPADKRKGSRRSDFPYLNSELVLSSRANDVLGEVLADTGEIIQLLSKSGQAFYLYNVRAIDALDESKSKVDYFPGSKRTMYLKEPVFRAQALHGIAAFRLPGSPTFVTDSFVDLVAENSLVGLEFDQHLVIP